MDETNSPEIRGQHETCVLETSVLMESRSRKLSFPLEGAVYKDGSPLKGGVAKISCLHECSVFKCN